MQDITKRAVLRQLAQLGARVEIGILFKGETRKDDKMIERTWSTDEVINSLGWLKRKNVEGGNIFVRPAGPSGLVFFDDYTTAMVSKLEEAGLKPAVLQRSSPLNYQGWIRLSDEPIEPELATACAQVIAKRFGGDYNSADWRHYGRLSGFTNRKANHMTDDGKYPFVILDSVWSQVAPGAADIVGAAHEHLAEKLAALRVELPADLPRATGDASVEFARELRTIESRWQNGDYGGDKFNRSKADWMICTSLIKKGYGFQQIETALLHNSPKATSETAKNALHYVNETMKKLRLLVGANAG